jgi:hypothetical protein
VPRARPPAAPPIARFTTLPAGTMLWRVEQRDGDQLHPLFRQDYPDDQRWGGRFDPGPANPTPYCYAATDDITAVAELLLREAPFDGPERYIPRSQIADRSLSILQVGQDLPLIALNSLAELAAVRQDTWLIQADPPDYVTTQLWGDWLRCTGAAPVDGTPAPAGFIWPSKRNPDGRCLVLFGERCGDQVFRSEFGSVPLDCEPGLEWLQSRLALLMTKISP